MKKIIYEVKFYDESWRYERGKNVLYNSRIS